MRVVTIRMHNFKSFVGDHCLDLQSHGPGLYYMRGTNHVDAELGSNGAGKSTVWEALYWALFGKTPRALRAGHVRSWGSDGACVVEVTVVVRRSTGEEKQVVVRRSQRPNKLVLVEDSVERIVEQERVEAVVGVSPLICQHSLFLGQGVPLFFDMPPASQTQVFQDALALDVWPRLSDVAKDAAQLFAGDKAGLEQEISQLEGQISTQKDLYEQYDKEARNFDLDQRNQRERMAKATEEARDGFQEAVERHVKTEDVLRECRGSVETQQMNVEKCRVRMERSLASYTVAESDAASVGRDVAVMQKKEQAIVKLSGECPTCFQQIEENHVERCTKELADQIAVAEADWTAKQKVADDLKRLMVHYTDEHRDAETALRAHETSLRQAETSERRAEQRVGEASRAVKTLADELAYLDKAVNTAQKHKLEVYHLLEESRKKVKAVREQWVEVCGVLESVSFWTKGFKQVRLVAIDKALGSLEIEVNRALQELGLVGWRVQFEVERETVSGSVAKGMTVQFYAPGMEQPAPWGSWSGGESQRLGLAGRIGIANLIRQQGFASSIEVWDEPTQFLSQDGIDQLVGVLQARARDLGIMIWLVDHRSYSSGMFAGELQVNKTRKGSCFEWR